MDKVKQQKKSQLNYYLNIIGEMQKQIELLRQLNQFYDKNSSIQVKQLKFQKSLDSLVKSDHDSLNLFQETIKISKINTNLVQKESSEAQNHLNTFKYCDKKDTFQKSYKQKLQKENSDYQKHLSQLKHQIMKNNEKQKFKLLKATIDKRNFRNTSLQRTKIGNKKSQFYVKNCYLPENKIVKSIKAKYEKNKFLVMQSQIDKKINMVKQSLFKQVNKALQ